MYYRLNVLPIRLPPLRERPEDLDALTDHLLDDIARRSNLPLKTLAADALDLLGRHTWPGNIRELRNVLEQACLMTDDELLGARHFAGVLTVAAGATSGPVAPPAPTASIAQAAEHAGSAATTGFELGKPLSQAVAELEAHAIRAALQATGNNKQATARLLGMARATLYEKLALFSLEADTRSV